MRKGFLYTYILLFFMSMYAAFSIGLSILAVLSIFLLTLFNLYISGVDIDYRGILLNIGALLVIFIVGFIAYFYFANRQRREMARPVLIHSEDYYAKRV